MRVAMLGPLPPLKGLSNYCVALGRSVSRLVPVEFVTFRAMYPPFLYPGGPTTDRTFAMPPTPNLTVRRTLRWYDPLGWAIEAGRLRADVAHAQHWSLPVAPVLLAMLGLLKRRGVKTTLTVHNTTPHEDSRAYMATMRWIGRLADCCILPSEHNARQAAELLGLAPSRLRVIRPGAEPVDPGSAADRAAARRRLALPADCPVAMFFGLIRRYKGVDVLLRAFARALPRAPQARLLIAGKPWVDWTAYEELIEQLGIARRVHAFPRYVPQAQVADFYRAADLAVLPYRGFDAQSGVGTSCLGYGVPMLVTRTGALPELVPDGRQVVPPDDVGALAERLAESLGDTGRLARMRREAARHARAFSWESAAEQIVAVYRELCESRRASP